MIEFPKVYGDIEPVPLEKYNEIIKLYVDKVSQLSNVEDIIQIGSFSAPGISDIDIIITIDDSIPGPKWNKISLKEITKDCSAKEVIAHDIFVLPSSLKKYAEAYFYIDQQNVLKGKRIGGILDQTQIIKLKKLLALEYAIFTLETIFNICLEDNIHIRKAILLLSTSRHTAKLAGDLSLITIEEQNLFISEIEGVRKLILEQNKVDIPWNIYYLKFLNLLSMVAFQLSEELTKDVSVNEGGVPLKNIIRTGEKVSMLGVSSKEDYLEFLEWTISLQRGSKMYKNAKIFPAPLNFIHYLKTYYGISETLRTIYPKEVRLIDDNEDLNLVKKIREQVITKHWKFLIKNSYQPSSGKAYCGFSFRDSKGYKKHLRNILRSVYNKIFFYALAKKKR